MQLLVQSIQINWQYTKIHLASMQQADDTLQRIATTEHEPMLHIIDKIEGSRTFHDNYQRTYNFSLEQTSNPYSITKLISIHKFNKLHFWHTYCSGSEIPEVLLCTWIASAPTYVPVTFERNSVNWSWIALTSFGVPRNTTLTLW